MFENLKAAQAAELVVINNERHPKSFAPWSSEVYFKGNHVATINGYPAGRTLTLSMAEQVQLQILVALRAQGFELDLSKIPRYSIHPDSPFNQLLLSLVQIADELELLAELKVVAQEQTLVLLSDDQSRVAVFDSPFTDELKERILRDYAGQVVEFINESFRGL